MSEQDKPVAWHNPRADKLREALRDIADTKNLTATPEQFARALQRMACDALTSDAMDEPAPPATELPALPEPIQCDNCGDTGEYEGDDGETYVCLDCDAALRGEVKHGTGESRRLYTQAKLDAAIAADCAARVTEQLTVAEVLAEFDKRAAPGIGFYDPHEPAEIIREMIAAAQGSKP